MVIGRIVENNLRLGLMRSSLVNSMCYSTTDYLFDSVWGSLIGDREREIIRDTIIASHAYFKERRW